MLIGSLSAMNVHTGAAIIQLKWNQSIHADVGVRHPQCHLKHRFHLVFDSGFFMVQRQIFRPDLLIHCSYHDTYEVITV